MIVEIVRKADTLIILYSFFFILFSLFQVRSLMGT